MTDTESDWWLQSQPAATQTPSTDDGNDDDSVAAAADWWRQPLSQPAASDAADTLTAASAPHSRRPRWPPVRQRARTRPMIRGVRSTLPTSVHNEKWLGMLHEELRHASAAVVQTQRRDLAANLLHMHRTRRRYNEERGYSYAPRTIEAGAVGDTEAARARRAKQNQRSRRAPRAARQLAWGEPMHVPARHTLERGERVWADGWAGWPLAPERLPVPLEDEFADDEGLGYAGDACRRAMLATLRRRVLAPAGIEAFPDDEERNDVRVLRSRVVGAALAQLTAGADVFGRRAIRPASQRYRATALSVRWSDVLRVLAASAPTSPAAPVALLAVKRAGERLGRLFADDGTRNHVQDIAEAAAGEFTIQKAPEMRKCERNIDVGRDRRRRRREARAVWQRMTEK